MVLLNIKNKQKSDNMEILRYFIHHRILNILTVYFNNTDARQVYLRLLQFSFLPFLLNFGLSVMHKQWVLELEGNVILTYFL